MNQKKTAQRRFGVLIVLSLLLHVGGYHGIDWRRLFAPDDQTKRQDVPESVTRRFNLVPKPTEPSPLKSEAPLPEPVLSEEPPIKVEPEVVEESHLAHNADESSSNNQQNRDSGQIVFGGNTPGDKLVTKPGDVKTPGEEVRLAKKTPAQLDKVAPTPTAPTQADVGQEASEGGKTATMLTTESERALWSVPGSDESSEDIQSDVSALKPGESDAKGYQEVTTEQNLSPEKQALRKRVEEDLKALFGENFSRETHKVETLKEVDVPDLETPGEGVQAQGNLNMLTDPQLREVGVEQPFSEQESEELRVVNLILERMNKQVIEHWVNPYKGGKIYRGVIKVELDEHGYLRDAFVYHPSGLVLLDVSVLDAIRAVKRYEVPDNKIIAERYYSNLSFHYSSLDEKPEMMPFERDGKKKDEKAKSGAKESKDNTNKTAKNTRSQQTDPKHANTKETP